MIEYLYNTPSDTPRHVMEMQIAIAMKKTPLQRLNMGTDMIDFGYEMLKKQIIATTKTSRITCLNLK